jgi:hypothetical protein
VFIAPDGSDPSVNVKYVLGYNRVPSALETRAKATIEWANASDKIFELMDSDADELPVLLHLDERVSDEERADNRSELDGAIWFVSLLTRVDGLVLMEQDLRVVGFGVEITAAQEPKGVLLAKDPLGRDTEALSYTRWGTRHRSMMRLCWQVPQGVGFVLSQDGDVRVMTRVSDSVVVWENPLLQMRIDESAPVDTSDP